MNEILFVDVADGAGIVEVEKCIVASRPVGGYKKNAAG